MTKVVVSAGACRMDAAIEVNLVGPYGITVTIHSDCKMVAELGDALKDLDWRNALKPPVKSEIYRAASESGLHPACPVPVAVLKAIEVETKLALPQSVVIDFEDSQ